MLLAISLISLKKASLTGGFGLPYTAEKIQSEYSFFLMTAWTT